VIGGNSDGFGINNSGTVVGVVNNTALGGARAFVTSGGSMTSLDAYDTTILQSRAYSVNSQGAVVGMAIWSNNWNAMTYRYSGTYNAATGVYSGGSWSYTDVNSLLGAATGAGSGGSSEAFAINDAGTVTGGATATATTYGFSTRPQAFVLNSAGAATIMSPLAGMDSSQGEDINAKGDVAGYSWLSTNGSSYTPFLAVNSPGGYTEASLGVPAGSSQAKAVSLNNYDMMVGNAQNSTTNVWQGYLWTTGVVPFYGLPAGAYNLTTLATNAGLLPPGWVITAESINDAGQISGTVIDTNSDNHALILSLPQALPGDALLDGKVDINDLTIVLAHYGQTGASWSTGDFNDDGKVDINDLTIVLAHYNQTAGTALSGSLSAVPEPGSLLLLVLAGISLLAFARRAALR
jgi:probable HAF family extracellular repeat protein